MANTSTKYANKLSLRSPLIIASSGLTSDPKKIKELANAGAGAVVLKSIFEEQMEQEVSNLESSSDFPGAMEYLQSYVQDHALSEHTDLIKACKDSLEIPVIASINCYKADTWKEYAHSLVEAGADALELNVMRIDTDRAQEWGTAEKGLVQMVADLTKALPRVPVTLKLSKYYTNIISLCRSLSISGAEGVVLFNRSYFPDIDIHNEAIVSGPIFSSETDLLDGIRYTSLVRGAVPDLSIAISSGARDGKDLVKGLLAGADAVQYCTALYKGGARIIEESLAYLTKWMEKHKYAGIDEVVGRLAATRIDHANVMQRSQFMKHFSSHDDRPVDSFGGNIDRNDTNY